MLVPPQVPLALAIKDRGEVVKSLLVINSHSKNAPHLESAITLGVFVQMFATANCSGGTPKKVSNNILLDPSRKTIFRSTGEIGVSNELH